MIKVLKPTIEVLQVMARLRHDKEFEVLLDFMRDAHKALQDECEGTNEDCHLRQAQGASQAVRQMIDYIEGSRESLEKKK
ncbi:MAG: hypothetical protein ACOCZ7_00165 [Armatimonadota bacterium]